MYKKLVIIAAMKFSFLWLRVTVPRSSLLSPYRLKPHRRNSFDPTDSVGLSSHCLAGWESTKPAVVPMPSSLDLQTSLHRSQATLVSIAVLSVSCSIRGIKFLVSESCNIKL